MGDALDKLFDPTEVARRWTRGEPSPPPSALRTARQALADLVADVQPLPLPDRARLALEILLGQVAALVAVIEPTPPPAVPAAPAELARPRAELAALLDRIEDHLEALVLYRPRSP